eukprot:673766-Lingulodinium_polyedra.AAC.1
MPRGQPGAPPTGLRPSPAARPGSRPAWRSCRFSADPEPAWLWPALPRPRLRAGCPVGGLPGAPVGRIPRASGGL